MPYYTLIHADDLAPGAHLDGLDDDGAPLIASADPRALSPSEIPALEDFDVAQIVLGTTAVPVRLARLTPTGPVTPQAWVINGDEALHPRFVQAPGWTLEAIEPLDGFLGPNAIQLTAAIRAAVHVLGDEDGAVRAAYDQAIDAMDEQHGSCAVWKMECAAEAALNAYGADGWWWGTARPSCTSGPEFLALAARDLIGTVPAWTQDTYNTLTQPWRAAFGRPIHDPGDAPMAEGATR